jgi:hypothetical protein
MLTQTVYQMHQNFILFVQITVSAASASCLFHFHPILFFFAVFIDASGTSASVSVCSSETDGDYPVHNSKTSVLLVLLAFAETVD